MGDRTNIADALERMAVEAEDGYSIPAGPSEVTTFRDAARLLRADPDTSDELFTEARRLLDAYPEDVFESPPQDWKAGMVTGTVPDAVDEDGYLDVWITPDAFAAHVLRKIALPVIATLLERAVTAEADRGEAERRERTAVNLANYHRDVARTAGGRAEHAEAEARQLREAIETAESVGVDYCTLHHGIRNEDEHSCDFRDDDQESGDDGEPRECVLVELIPRPPLAAARCRG